MSLDQNLFTLFFTPNPSYPAGTVVDLTDGLGTVHYRKRRIASEQQHIYRIEVSDPLSEALLASATAPSATSKHKTLELYNPSNIVELKYTGMFTFRWTFKWETHEFEWKREECFIIRKPDPPVLVAATKEPPGRIRTTSVQVLDYNLNRFEINDRKGLEIVILTALLTFTDASNAYHESNMPVTVIPPTSASMFVSSTSTASSTPTAPPRPAPKKGTELLAELQLGRGQANEVTVLEEGAISDYAKYCARLLRNDAMVFISVRSSDSNQVPKALRVVEETKRLRYKAGDPDLQQYVLDDSKAVMTPQKGPRTINLDDNNGKGKQKGYTPPKSLTIYLSKIDMPELRPRSTLPKGDGGRKRENKSQSKHAKEKYERTKERGNDQDGRLRTSTSPPHPIVLHKQRTQYVHPTTSIQASSGSVPQIPLASYCTPPLPPRSQQPAVMHRRQSMYGPLNADDYYHDYEGTANMTSSPGNSSLTSRLLGRLLG